MSSEPIDVNTSHLEALAKIGGEEAGLRELIDKATAFRNRSIEVCERVVRDYQTRIDALDEQARALKENARADLRNVESRHEQARRDVEKARFDQQEIDFRYEIGEIAGTEYPQRRKAADEALAQSEATFASLDALKRRFLAALGEATSAPGPVTPSPTAEPIRIESAADPAVAEPARVPPDKGAHASAAPFGQMGTIALAPAPASTGNGEGPASERPTTEEDLVVGDKATLAVAAAVLRDEDPSGAIHQLSFITTIGRTPDNQISVAEAEVSRHHARICLTDAGFVLEDLKSGNGTYLNEVRIAGEQVLKNEDRIRVGGRTFVFSVQ